MLLKTTLAASLIALVAFTGLAHAQMTPTGLWKTIDDDSKKEKSLVRITESNGVFSGRIETPIGSILISLKITTSLSNVVDQTRRIATPLWESTLGARIPFDK